MAYQIIDRLKKFKNLFPVIYIWEYYLKKSFNDRILVFNIKKAISDIIAELNKKIFR